MAENKRNSDCETVNNEFVTVVSVGTENNNNNNIEEGIPLDSANNPNTPLPNENGFVTVLTIGDNVLPNPRSQPVEIVEEVQVYRLPGERLGFGLKFEGGTRTAELVERLFIQSCAPDSPASRAGCSWGKLMEGDEILKIDGEFVNTMTRIDCVRSLKDSNICIFLLVKHYNDLSSKSSNSIDSSFHSDEELSADEPEKNKDQPGSSAPPPIPPRKTKMLTKSRESLHSDDGKNSTKHGYPKSAPRTSTRLDVPKVPIRDRKLSDTGSNPPDAEVYLDLLTQESEYGMRTESESDDTGSTISTVIDKHNFIASTSSSIASDSIPTTPTAVQKQLDLNKVLNPFELLEVEYASNIKSNNEFLFTKFVTSHDEHDSKTIYLEKNSLIPPANFQDAPLSYGTEDVTTITQHNEPDNILIDFEELEKREELKIPTPVPRKCYAKKQKSDPEEFQQTTEDLPVEITDVNLPRLVNFLPKNPQKTPTVQQSPYPALKPIESDEELHEEEEEVEEVTEEICYADEFLCLDTCEMFELNNNKCDKIISCSTWSLASQPIQLETIGEIEDETDSLEPKAESSEDIIPDAMNDNTASNEIDKMKHEDKIHPILTTNSNIGDYADKNNSSFNHHTSDKVQSSFNDFKCESITDSANIVSDMDDEIRSEENDTTRTLVDELTVINLTEDVQNPNENNVKDVKSTSSTDTTIIDQMEVSNFIQSEQNHTITTSEYSSLSSLSSPPLSISSRFHSDSTDYSSHEIDNLSTANQTLSPLQSKLKAPAEKLHMPLDNNIATFSVDEHPITVIKNPRSSIWKKDEQSSKSIKDKIAIFSATENFELPPLPQDFSRVSKTFKSSENIVDDRDKLGKSNKFSKSCLNIDKPEQSINNNNEKSCDVEVKITNDYSDTRLSEVPITKPNLRLHTRSQSMQDMSSLDSPWNNSESRRFALNTLIEQRRKGISKLRGLVIPQNDVPIGEPVLDLPVIHSKETTLVSKPLVMERSKSESLEPVNQRSNFIQSPPSWKSNSTIVSNLPRYSPAFKRKCLQVYVMEQSSTNSQTPTKERDDGKDDEVFIKPTYNPIKPQIRSSIKSIPADTIYELIPKTNETQVQYVKKPTALPRTKQEQVTDDSDNDSAVSSSQSSYISRECSPLPSPLQDYNILQSSDGLYGRVLKPQSVEAINRKNILASAKCRSGRDFKNGSPLIQRKLSGTEDVIIEDNQVESSPEYETASSDEVDIKSISSSSSTTLTEPIKEIIVSEVKIELPEKLPPVPIPNLKPQTYEEPKTKLETTKATIPNVVLRSTVRKLPERPTSMFIPTTSRYDQAKRASVVDIRKQFEKMEIENQPASPEIKIPKNKTSPLQSPTKVLPDPKLADIVPKIENKTTAEPKPMNGLPEKMTKEDLQKLVQEFNKMMDKTVTIKFEDLIEVTIPREYVEGSIGITLTGGTDYESKEITVHKVITGGIADKDGRLKKGDRILSINSKKMLGVTHKESVDILKDPQPEVTFVVIPSKAQLPASSQPKANIQPTTILNNSEKVITSTETSANGYQIHHVELIKDGAGLGFSLDGGKDSPKGDQPLLIKKIFTGGSAEKCGKLKAGDELLEVNGIEVHKMTRIEGWSLMKKLPDGKVTLTIRR